MLEENAAIFGRVFSPALPPTFSLTSEELGEETLIAVTFGYGLGRHLMRRRGYSDELKGSGEQVGQMLAEELHLNLDASEILGTGERTFCDFVELASEKRLLEKGLTSRDGRGSIVSYLKLVALNAILFAISECIIRAPQPLKSRSSSAPQRREVREPIPQAMPWELFFVDKIQQGLGSRVLSDRERRLLLTPLQGLVAEDVTSVTAERLQTKAIEALSVAYREDTEGKNREAGVVWRKNNEALYQRSQLVISGIVQNWYLRVGRSLEKSAFGCGSLLALVMLLLVSLVFLIC
jgi:hypothetical protein